MKVFDRLFLFLYSISFLIVAFFALLVGLGFFKYEILYQITDLLYSNYDLKVTVIVVSAIIIILSIYFLIKSLQTKSEAAFSNKKSEIGEIRISMDTLENIASKVAAKVKGVKEQKVRVRLEDNETVSVIIKLFVDGETPIPQLSEEIQLNVKQTVEQTAGIEVGQVHIIVTNVGKSNQKRARVE